MPRYKDARPPTGEAAAETLLGQGLRRRSADLRDLDDDELVALARRLAHGEPDAVPRMQVRRIEKFSRVREQAIEVISSMSPVTASCLTRIRVSPARLWKRP